jgi:hypothetical protein
VGIYAIWFILSRPTKAAGEGGPLSLD